MTQEEKARRYDEALEIARKFNEEYQQVCGINMLECVFPEIKMSEDERREKTPYTGNLTKITCLQGKHGNKRKSALFL